MDKYVRSALITHIISISKQFMTKKLFSFLLSAIILFGCTITVSAQSASSESHAYFSPNGGIRDKIIARINLTKKSINLAIYSFTSGDIANALESAKNRGVKISIIADKSQSTGKSSEINYLISKGFNVKILKGKGRGIMHNKFAVFDDKEVVTGSYNWTDNAEYNNYENAIFIMDSSIINAYKLEFNKLLKYE